MSKLGDNDSVVPDSTCISKISFLSCWSLRSATLRVRKPYLISTAGRRWPCGCCPSVCVRSPADAAHPSPCQSRKRQVIAAEACLPQCRHLMGKQRSKQSLFTCSPPHYWMVRHISLQRGSQTSKIKCKWTKDAAWTWSSTVTPQATMVYVLGLWNLALLLCQDLQKWAFLPYFKSTVNFVSKAVFWQSEWNDFTFSST